MIVTMPGSAASTPGTRLNRLAAIPTSESSRTTQFALRWVIDQPGVSTVIPGARNAEQVRGNAAAAGIAPLRDEQLAAVRDVYDRLIRPHVHDRW